MTEGGWDIRRDRDRHGDKDRLIQEMSPGLGKTSALGGGLEKQVVMDTEEGVKHLQDYFHQLKNQERPPPSP